MLPTYSELVLAFQGVDTKFTIAIDPNNTSLLYADFNILEPQLVKRGVRQWIGPAPRVKGESAEEVIKKLMQELSKEEGAFTIYHAKSKMLSNPDKYCYKWDDATKDLKRVCIVSVDLDKDK